MRLQLHSQHWTHLACQALSSTLRRNRSKMGRSHPAHWTIISPACRTPSADLPTRTALLGLGHSEFTRNNVLAQRGVLSGENWRDLSFKGSGVTIPENCCSPGPVWSLSCYLSQSTNPEEKRGEKIQLRQLMDCVMAKPDMFSRQFNVNTSFFKRVYF